MKAKDKGNGKKTFQSIEQGKAQRGDAKRQRLNHQRNYGNQRFGKDFFYRVKRKGIKRSIIHDLGNKLVGNVARVMAIVKIRRVRILANDSRIITNIACIHHQFMYRRRQLTTPS